MRRQRDRKQNPGGGWWFETKPGDLPGVGKGVKTNNYAVLQDELQAK